MDGDGVKVHKHAEKERQYPALLSEQGWLVTYFTPKHREIFQLTG